MASTWNRKKIMQSIAQDEPRHRINWLRSRTQFQACYSFSRLASASAAPTIGHCKELNKLCRQIRNDEVEMRVWPVKSSPRIIGIPDAAFRNNSNKSSPRAMTIFIADERVKGRRDTRGSLMFFESTKIKRTTLSTTVAELYALMKCFGTCQMLRGLWKDISGMDTESHIRAARSLLAFAFAVVRVLRLALLAVRVALRLGLALAGVVRGYPLAFAFGLALVDGRR